MIKTIARVLYLIGMCLFIGSMTNIGIAMLSVIIPQASLITALFTGFGIIQTFMLIEQAIEEKEKDERE